jgi:PAS domain S-box-containing protein
MNPSAILADHLNDKSETIVAMWRETILRDEDVPGADDLSYHELRDHIPEILDRLTERLRGRPEEAEAEGRTHGQLRFRQGYDIAEVVRELGHLRRALVRTCADYARSNGFSDQLSPVLEAIDEVIDGATAESVAQFQCEAIEAADTARHHSSASLAALESNLEEAEARYRSIVEHSPVMIWGAGPDGTREYFNRAWLEFRGHTGAVEDWVGGIHPDDRASCQEAYRRAIEGREPFRVTYRMMRHDGQYRSLLEQGIPYHDSRGRLLGYLGSCIDITERVELENALRESRELAEEASQRKTRLLSALSHDARTPLNAVALASQLLELHFRTGADPEVLDCLRMIRHSIDNVQDLLGDLLNLSRIDAGGITVQPETFPLERALAECLSGIEPQARLKGLDCRLEPGPLAAVEVHTDRSKFKQIISNLLSNALRFTSQGRVRLFATADAGQLHIGVEDTGVGIDPADQSRIFEEFARLESPHRPTGEGTGLGLAICRRLANLLGGEITVESAVGRGSTFRLILPGTILIGPVAANGEPRLDADGAAADPAVPPAPGTGGAILIAEDHLASRQALSRVLRRLGYTPLEASNGHDAIILARRERPLAVLMDVAMPVMDGIEATSLLRADPATRDVPIFALTGDVTLVTRERIGQAGISGFLEKPVTPEALNRALATLRPATN